MVIMDKTESCSGDESRLKFTVIFVHDGEGFLFCRKRSRDTWECAGGHIEAGETAEKGALRELYEETGLRLDRAEAVFDYHATMEEDPSDNSWGRVFLCRTDRLDPPPTPPNDFEMAETRIFAGVPEKLSYPGIQGEMLRMIRESLLLEALKEDKTDAR